MIVGAFEEAHFSETALLLDGGVTLFHTDGVTQSSSAGEFFGEVGLIETVADSRRAGHLCSRSGPRVSGAGAA